VILVSKDDLVEKEIAKTRAKSAIKIQHWKEQRHFRKIKKEIQVSEL